ncbi:hypothetical protein Y032_0043g837 [Ancylostoma ceylanicum]|uniref:Uncharacterized protein n=1 Tax=Ancylostoma ceylanicum TaxID=53326 RepID=A0A016UGC7_9BILA|nr:hypothetical protein Y032_0043g837 [Ancylostoma ceylanicum]
MAWFATGAIEPLTVCVRSEPLTTGPHAPLAPLFLEKVADRGYIENQFHNYQVMILLSVRILILIVSRIRSPPDAEAMLWLALFRHSNTFLHMRTLMGTKHAVL